jgi:hypothetical protein
LSELHPSQAAALLHVGERARQKKARALEIVDEIRRMSDLAADAYERAVARIRSHARVALHFHPDRPDAADRSVAAALLDAGVYKSQFETQLSSGHLSAFAGGARDGWERTLFGAAYHVEGVTAAQRPKYGALDLMLHPDGPAPRFGSAYFVLRPAVSQRCSFTYLGSQDRPDDLGTVDELDWILAQLLFESFTRDFALGERGLRPRALIRHLGERLEAPFDDRFVRAPARNLDHFIEAQVHGDVRLDEDVERLVADPSFAGTEVGGLLERMCDRFGIALRWHGGFVLAPSEVPSDFRGATMPSLAARVAVDGRVDAHAIGRAAVQLKRDPGAWADRGSYAEVLQELKLLWHVLVRFGRARASSAPAA